MGVDYNEMSEYLESAREMEDALSVKVKLGWREVLKVVVRDLINKRNSPGNKDRESFDKVLMYYLGEEDFEKYVTKGKKIK